MFNGKPRRSEENEAKVIFEGSVAENFPELMKYINLQIQNPNKSWAKQIVKNLHLEKAIYYIFQLY